MTDLMSWPREWRRGELSGGANSVNGIRQRRKGKRIVTFSSARGTWSTMAKWVRLKQLLGFPHVFHNTLRPNHNPSPCPSSPAARDPVSVTIPLDHLRKKKSKDAKRQMLAIVRQRWTRRWEGKSYPAFVVWERCIESESFVVRW
jgi:hypothetical protein